MSNNYHAFVTEIQKQLAKMSKTGLFVVDIDKDEFYNLYLDSFPEGTNNVYRERREYDCNCCKNFIRDVGRVVTFVDNEIVSVWDITVPGYYQAVVDSLANKVRNSNVVDQFFHYERRVGLEKNNVIENGKVVTYNHFYAVLPSNVVYDKGVIPTKQNDIRGIVQVFERSMKELTLDAAETIKELTAQGSLYRGNEFRGLVDLFIKLKKEYDRLSISEKQGFLWTMAVEHNYVLKFRNTALGTLLENLSNDMDLEAAVKAWEKVMAPTNYKRPTSLITKGMIEQAQKTVAELGMEDSLARRYATIEDITINNVLFANREAKKLFNVFEELSEESVKGSSRSLNKVEKVSAEHFFKNILPSAERIDAFVGNNLAGNFVSLIAPVHADATNMLKWDNNFSWSYNGEVTDSIKERVKAAGGNTDSPFRVSLSWSNGDDLDLSVVEPGNYTVYFGNRNRRSPMGGQLDVDMNAGGIGNDVDPVENIYYSDLVDGVYGIFVHNYRRRSNTRSGFSIQVEVNGEIYNMSAENNPQDGNKIQVASVKIVNGKVEKITGKMKAAAPVSKKVWGINTENFKKVSVIMNSPNHWDNNKTGLRHYFFMLEGCANPEGTRGFYNEYLRPELNKHKKVFEVLAEKMKVATSDQQLAGIGFSETSGKSVILKVAGKFNRVIEVTF